jgi:hypothetical protein
MINHKIKCIFIHIPRTGGSSIEETLHGADWWQVKASTKHLIASTAKRIYSEYWDDYFKFSFVRNPWDRMRSMAKFPNFYGCVLKNNTIDISGYIKKFRPVEIDPRSVSDIDRGSIPYHKDSVYLNILNEELDFVGNYETLEQDFDYVCNMLSITTPELAHTQKQHRPALKSRHYTEYYNDASKQAIEKIYMRDIKHFDYKFN